MFTTEITRLFDIRLPVVAGGLMWLADADYVSAAARAGVMGYITAASFPQEEQLRAQIRKCRAQSEGRAFGVNVSMLPRPSEGERTQQIFELIADEGVRFVETSGRNPEAFLPFLQSQGIKVTHKVASVKHAVKAQDAGVDVVAIVGGECGGHPGLEMVGSLVNAAWARRSLRVPYLIGGGVGDGSQVPALIAMGAAGALIGTRFLVAEEIWAHRTYKERIAAAQPSDTTLCMQSVRNPIRALVNETTALVQDLERSRPDLTIQDLMPHVAGRIARAGYESGDLRHGLMSAGEAVAFADRIEPFAEIVRHLEDEMRDAMHRLRAVTNA